MLNIFVPPYVAKKPCVPKACCENRPMRSRTGPCRSEPKIKIWNLSIPTMLSYKYPVVASSEHMRGFGARLPLSTVIGLLFPYSFFVVQISEATSGTSSPRMNIDCWRKWASHHIKSLSLVPSEGSRFSMSVANTSPGLRNSASGRAEPEIKRKKAPETRITRLANVRRSRS